MDRIGAECQCSLGRDQLKSAPVGMFDITEDDDDWLNRDSHTAPASSPDLPRPQPAFSIPILVTFRFPGPLDYVLQRTFQGATPMRILRSRLARLLTVPSSSLVLAHEKIPYDDRAPLANYKNPAYDTVVIDVHVAEDVMLSLPREKYFGGHGKRHIEFIVVKFRVQLQKEQFTRSFDAGFTILDVMKNLAEPLKMKAENLIISRGALLKLETVLRALDYDIFGCIDLDLKTKDGARIDVDLLYEQLQSHDVLRVSVPCGPCGYDVKQVNVEIIDSKIKKPYLGGYRNVHSKIEYHHAYTQTQPRPPKVPTEYKNERDTQTAEEREKIDDTSYSRATQMCDAVYIPNVTDRIVVAGPYETYDQMMARLRLHHHAAVIQRAYRAYRYRLMIYEWLRRCKERIERMREEERIEKERFETRLKKDLVTKTYPKTREDFDQLYAMVERWKNAEIARITKLHSKGPRIAEFTILLDKEIELLRNIEEYRVKIKKDNNQLKEKAFLDEISKPVTWYGIDNKIITMDTIEAQRARKLRELYDAFCKEDNTVDQRMELLVDLKYSLQDFVHPLTDEISSLVERECDLLVRNCTKQELEFLRKRIRAAMFQFIKTSELNAGVTRRKDVAKIRTMSDGKLYICDMCNQCKPYTEFPFQARTATAPAGKLACTSCAWQRACAGGEGAGAADSAPYKFMLRAVQREERRKRCWGSLAFVLQDRDMHYLAEKVWHAHSAIGGCTDLMQLRLCRWHRDKEWSPWNCLMVTVPEMHAHLRLENPEEAYDEELVRKVHNKHAVARVHFKRLFAVDDRITGTGEWHNVRAKAADHVDGIDPL